MITEKDKEDTIKAIHDAMMQDKYLMSNKQEREQYALFILENYTERIRIESADQARKEAAEIAVAFVDNNLMGIADCDIGLLTDLRAAILDDSTADRTPDTEEKLHPEITNDYVKKLEDDLAIAVNALEKINERHSFADIVDDSYIISRDALKEIQG